MQKLRVTVLFLIAFLVTSTVRAQVTIDIAKITCQQYLTFSVADPRDIAIWLSGYSHGKRNSTVLEPQELKDNAEKLKSACFLEANSKLPVMQVVETVLGYGK
jgi:acid stress chaperone HdeB